jgi:hypothetical protein
MGREMTMKATKAITTALATLRSEYFRQLTDLAINLRPGFEFGGFGAEVWGSDSPAQRLSAAIRARFPNNANVIAMVRESSPNNWQALDEAWATDYIGAIETIAIDLCVIAEAQRWMKKGQTVATWTVKGKKTPVQPVPVRIPRLAA